jgi:hypothetical protein
MKRIKNFSESGEQTTKIWCVIIVDPDSPFGIRSSYNHCPCFTSEMLAADHVIKYVNSRYDQKFEPFLDKNGDRFFADIDENEDYDDCLEYCKDEGIKIDIEQSTLNSKPRITK